MHAVQDEVETIHLYVVREHVKQPYTIGPLLCAVLCLLGAATLTLYSAQHPYYEQQRLIVPVQLLPLKTFTAQAPIIPTGIKSYPATTAHGTLTITNGSIIGQLIPTGFAVQGVVTDRAVYVPPGSANGYGMATVSAHAILSGIGGNFAILAINQVEGSSVYIRNLSAFHGGQDAYSVKYVSEQDRQTATVQARSQLASEVNGLHYPCGEDRVASLRNMIVTWRCQFVTFRVPSYMHVFSMRLVGKNLVVSVWFIAPVKRIWVK